MWTDVRAVTERVLWIMTACKMPFEAVSERPCANMQGNLIIERRLCDELLQNWKPCLVSHAWYPRQAPWVTWQGDFQWPQVSSGWSHLLRWEELVGRSCVKRRNELYSSVREEDESARTLSKTEHPESVMSLSFCCIKWGNGVSDLVFIVKKS